MTRFPIYPNYDHRELPIGFVEINEEVPMEVLNECAIIPALIKQPQDSEFKTVEFGLVQRVDVDTRPRDLM